MNQPFYKISFPRRLLSYLIPVTVAHTSSVQNNYLEFILYRNQWQLATEDALYSDGIRYLPFRMAFRYLSRQGRLSAIQDCLVLGTGLGSIVQILVKKYKVNAAFSLVENDNKILGWALEYLASLGIKNITPYYDDAGDFVAKHTETHGMVCIDLFHGREVPDRFIALDFLQQTKQLVKPGGVWIMNYIRIDEPTTALLMINVQKLFKEVITLDKKQNRVLVAFA